MTEDIREGEAERDPLKLLSNLERAMLRVANRSERFAKEEVDTTEAIIRETSDNGETMEWSLEVARDIDDDTGEPLYTYEFKQTARAVIEELPAYAVAEIERERAEQERHRLFGGHDPEKGIFMMGGGGVAVDPDPKNEGAVLERLSSITYTLDMAQRIMHVVETHVFVRDTHHLVDVVLNDEYIEWSKQMFRPDRTSRTLRRLGGEVLRSTEAAALAFEAFRSRQEANRAAFAVRLEELNETLAYSGLLR